MTTTTTRRAYYHFTVGGELSVENPEAVSETVDSVACRWCGHGNGIEVLTEQVAKPE
ncbi:MAG: hypothetical protein WCO31_01035 [Actinomycetes bacterium]